jgi:bile acid:Na+ symporter, BASS family
MSLTGIITLVLQAGIALGIFAVGLKANLQDATFLFRSRDQLLSAMVCMFVAMPLVAVILALPFNLPPAVKIALVVYSVSPIPPLLPIKAQKAGGRESYCIGLLVAGSLVSIVLIPLAMELFQVIFNVPLQMTALSVAMLVLTTVLAPLAAGMAVGALWPRVAERAAGSVATVSNVLLIATLVPVLIVLARPMLSVVGGGALAAMAALGAAGLFLGHMIGGPRFEDRTVLALYTSARHPGVAIAIAQANFPDQRLAMPAILLVLVVSAILSVPYMNWVKHHKPSAPAAAS